VRLHSIELKDNRTLPIAFHYSGYNRTIKEVKFYMESKQLMHEPYSRSAFGPSESIDQTKIALANKSLSVSTVPSNTSHYYFQNILRFDLLSKLNYNNIMQVPHITKINILVHSVPIRDIHPVSLALEIIIGQKVFFTILADGQNQAYKAVTRAGFSNKQGPQRKNGRSKHLVNLKPGKITGSAGSFSHPSAALLCCSLRGRTMYNFLEKLISLRLPSFCDSEYNCKIQGQEVQLTFSTREVRLFPEIQNHFEFFESLKKIQIKLVTSGKSEKETQLLWSGLKQKEI
jgi:ribosomal protein L5